MARVNIGFPASWNAKFIAPFLGSALQGARVLIDISKGH